LVGHYSKMNRIICLCGMAHQAVASLYNEDRAAQFAKFAGASYCDESLLESWSCGELCDGTLVSNVHVCSDSETKAFVGMWEDTAIVSFQGTRILNLDAWLADFAFFQDTASTNFSAYCDNCRVHTGFQEAYFKLAPCIKSSLETIGAPVGSSIRTTGHSLGAAINNVAMFDLTSSGWKIEESYTFGCPRVGNAMFAAAFQKLFSDIPAFRVTHHKDPVPHVPPYGLLINSYEHVEPEVFYDGDRSAGYAICTEDVGQPCSDQYSNLPFDLIHSADHLYYIDVSLYQCVLSSIV